MLFARLAGSGLPRPVIAHRAFDAEGASILIDNDQEEWPLGFVFVHSVKYIVLLPSSTTRRRLGGVQPSGGALVHHCKPHHSSPTVIVSAARDPSLLEMKRTRNPSYGNLYYRR